MGKETTMYMYKKPCTNSCVSLHWFRLILNTFFSLHVLLRKIANSLWMDIFTYVSISYIWHIWSPNEPTNLILWPHNSVWGAFTTQIHCTCKCLIKGSASARVQKIYGPTAQIINNGGDWGANHVWSTWPSAPYE